MKAPTLRFERELLRSGASRLAAIDEVGRGALAGPVTVGVVVVDRSTGTAPAGIRDSKLLAPDTRVALQPLIRRWCLSWAVGSASSDEIDRVGLTAALRLAGERALSELDVVPELVLLDGAHDWLTRPAVQGDLFADDEVADHDAGALPFSAPRVVTRVKADLTCSAVAAASVLAKVQRDALMVELSPRFPEFRWDENKGYASPEHLEALRRHGPTVLHRVSWNLPPRDQVGAEGG